MPNRHAGPRPAGARRSRPDAQDARRARARGAAACSCCRTSASRCPSASAASCRRRGRTAARRTSASTATRSRARAARAADLAELAAMIARFAADAADLVTALFPRYAPYVKRARTSYRPQPAVGRDVSWRKDDSRLHVDAFPSRPNRGERILRVFTNVNPAEARVWRVGEPFEAMAKTLLPRIRRPLPGSARAARRAARHQGPAQRLRPPDARPARPREGGPGLPARLRAAGRALRARHDVALLLRPGDARGGVGPVHARADDPSAGLGAVRPGARAARDPRAPDRPRAGRRAARIAAAPAARAARGAPRAATPPRCQCSRTTPSCARCGASRRRTRRSG